MILYIFVALHNISTHAAIFITQPKETTKHTLLNEDFHHYHIVSVTNSYCNYNRISFSGSIPNEHKF